MASEEGYSKPEPYENKKRFISSVTHIAEETPREKIVRKPLPVIPHERYKLKPNSSFV